MTLRIDRDRLWRSLMEMGRIGATPGGGVGRLPGTDADREARDVFVRWCREAGCAVTVDRLGNIFARRPGNDPARLPVMTGSHLDSQPLGGKFDGAYGVMAALEVVRTLNDASVRTAAPVEIVAWTDEEGCRFSAGMRCSAVFAGTQDLDSTLALADPQGLTLGAELARIGYAGPEPVGGRAIDCFLECHIEQGVVLEAEGRTIGAVVGAQAQKNYEIRVRGEQGHAGTVPMTMRRDAMRAAARMIEAVIGLAWRFDPHPVVTVGAVHVVPNARNTIPREVVFTIDSRHPRTAVLAELGTAVRAACGDIARDLQVGVEIEQTAEREAVTFDPALVQAVRDAADRLGFSQRDMFSGAGHDSCNLAALAPTAMVFVPCEKGISHAENENAQPDDLAAGCDVLLQVVLERAGVAR